VVDSRSGRMWRYDRKILPESFVLQYSNGLRGQYDSMHICQFIHRDIRDQLCTGDGYGRTLSHTSLCLDSIKRALRTLYRATKDVERGARKSRCFTTYWRVERKKSVHVATKRCVRSKFLRKAKAWDTAYLPNVEILRRF
jgi:hypothetical protein